MKDNGFLKLLKQLVAIRELFMIILIIVTGIVLTNMSPHFFTHGNIQSVLIALVPNAIIAIGMTILLASGTFDLSVGGIMAFSGTLVGILLLSDVSIFLSVIITLAVGITFGIINGFFVAKIGVNPLITTFGMQSITRSLALIFTEGRSVSGLPTAFGAMGTVRFMNLPLMVWTMFILVVTSDVLLRKMRYFRQLFYIGGNANASLLSGIKVNRTKMVAFAISAGCATTAGIILASRIMAGTPTAGTGMELSVIAACVIGGASLNGGEGTVIGSVFGALFLALISNALIMMSVSMFWHGVVNGVILIAAVSIDMILKKRRKIA